MAENSKIEWTDHTNNPWWGCEKVHTGCKFCYAEYFSDTRYKNNLWGTDKRRRILSSFGKLSNYQRAAAESNSYALVFVGSMMDIFENSLKLENPINPYYTTGDLRNHLFSKIDKGDFPNLVFQFLTKRPENIPYMIPEQWRISPPQNLWFGTSISTGHHAQELVNKLVATGLSNLFLSIEPQISIISQLDLHGIKWVIQGGESGNNRRKFDIRWVYSMMDLCRIQGVPYFFKQIDKVNLVPEELIIKREFPIFSNLPRITLSEPEVHS